MSIQSLGVGSGLALDDLVSQLIDAERAPKQQRLDAKEESLDAQISGVGQLKSKMSDFLDSVDKLRSDFNLQGREPTIDNPDENVEPFTAEAANSAVKADYQVAINRLASGSRIESQNAVDGGFTSSNDSVLSAGSGSLTFKVNTTGDSFNINVTAGQTLQQLANAINSSEDNFGVNASIIATGTVDGGAKLVLTSSTTGDGNDLVVVNNNNLADLDRVSTTDSTETNTYLTPVVSAQNARATIDGIAVESTTNEFENTISGVSFEATAVSAKAADGITTLASKLTIGFDTQGLDKKIRDFVDNFNNLVKEIGTLTRYGTSDLEEDGALAGDFMARSISSGLSNIIASNVPGSALGSLFAIGVELNDDGELEISSDNEYGIGSGEDRLKDALKDNYDEIAALFTDSENGVAARLYSYTKEYTTFSGLLSTRERSMKDEKDQLGTEREQFELRMSSFEQILRDKYLNLDLTVAKLNSTGSALMASLGQG
ncbi:flagellar filament capping protein FliD [Aliiglaciecola sp. LCG003]|uniref:flagellar filament capping protein FliD n=1 Tax=Aliiglaciecola sp. LCG003 TaxID=3053655 RepID=UPI002572AE36|nr:flagellar filament capping protein FliD [Aliiglaciecola sp. LCG003]WJG10565.1 flagellar filament capping protein FliD [Aliiglaciecola sp. LCG003]